MIREILPRQLNLTVVGLLQQRLQSTTPHSHPTSLLNRLFLFFWFCRAIGSFLCWSRQFIGRKSRISLPLLTSVKNSRWFASQVFKSVVIGFWPTSRQKEVIILVSEFSAAKELKRKGVSLPPLCGISSVLSIAARRVRHAKNHQNQQIWAFPAVQCGVIRFLVSRPFMCKFAALFLVF